MTQSHFPLFAQRMEAAGLPTVFIETFSYYYQQLVDGHTGLIPEKEIMPVSSLPDAEALDEGLVSVGEKAMAQTAVIKLNGGLGTSMGLSRAKSLLPVKDRLSFLDIIARQVQHAQMPLILMNSFATNADSLKALSDYQLVNKLPLSFLQHKAPKVAQADLKPVTWPNNPENEWCPPGHGDIYTALVTSTLLDALLAQGYQYAFVSNADNLGAVIDPAILGFFVDNQFPFMMEVADRTEMDKKGGHLARRELDGQLILRESAQCPEQDRAYFQDVTRHRYFNTNNLWLNLVALKETLDAQNNQLHLPMIRNRKTVDPRDPDSPPVYQLETAMGSAIAVFSNAQALRVPRSRFAPVKTSNDLLAVRSDAYRLTDDFKVVKDEKRPLDNLTIQLDSQHYKFVHQFNRRFAYGVPSMWQCEKLTIEGNFAFGKEVVCQGEVHLVNKTEQQIYIADGMTLKGERVFE